MNGTLNLGDFEFDVFRLSNADRSFLAKMTSNLKPEYFASPVLSALFDVYQKFFAERDVAPTRRLAKLYVMKKLKDGEGLVEEVLNKCFAEGAINQVEKDAITREVTLFAKRARMKEAIYTSVDLINEDKFDEVNDVIGEALKFSMDVPLGYDLYDVKRRYDDLMSAMSNRMDTGYPGLNKVLGGGEYGGWMRKEIACVMGPPGMGKSIFLVNWGFHALANGYNVVHYSFEMSEARLGMRYDSVAAKLAQNQLINSRDKIEKSYQTLKSITETHLRMQEFPTSSASVLDIEAHLDKLRTIHNFMPDIVIVDYGDIMRATRACKNTYEEQGWIFRELRALAIKRNVAVLTATQTRRDALEPKGGTKEDVGMDQIADSMEKNRILDALFSIVQGKMDKANGKTSLFVAKNRNGPANATLPFNIDYEKMTISEESADLSKDVKNAMASEDAAEAEAAAAG